jgi:hypothetical protein
MVLREKKGTLQGREVGFLLKAYPPETLIVEGTVWVEDLLSEQVFSLKREILSSCREILAEYRCDKDFDEEYSVYCVSDYRGDPEVYLTLYGDRIANHLKNERIELDEEEIRTTLQSSIKYGKDDLTLVDWDGAFLFDPKGDFDANIELFEIANDQLLRQRRLATQLDRRLLQTALLLESQEKWFFRSKEIRTALKEIIRTRTQSILESASIEHNIKLIGDWYSAKLYSLISKKFHLDSWKTEIKEKLDTLEDIYTMATENFSVSYRATLEFVILGGWLMLLILYIGEFFLLKWYK